MLLRSTNSGGECVPFAANTAHHHPSHMEDPWAGTDDECGHTQARVSGLSFIRTLRSTDTVHEIAIVINEHRYNRES